MKKPEQYFCDMCGKEIMATSGFIDQIIPVVTDCEWTEGHPEKLHVDSLKMDLCKECYIKAFNIKCSYRGQNKRWITEDNNK